MRKIFNDPRTILFTFLTAYTIYALITPSFSRSWQEIALTMSTCIIVDYFFLRFYKRVNIFPTSGMICSYGIFLMCDSPHIWIYSLLAFLAIFIKHFITYNNKHIFNPNNVALVIGILLLDDKMTIVGGTWGGSTVLAIIIMILGGFLIFKANRVHVVLAFLITFIFLAIIRSQLMKTPLLWTMLPLTGPSFFLFTFYMITDPKTSPNNSYEQIFFGTILAIIDSLFRYNKNKYAPFLSLFIVTGCYPYIKILCCNTDVFKAYVNEKNTPRV
jgi:Na+-translocating ferredoxin:NAD+ oxidoreductase RnfD subunit